MLCCFFLLIVLYLFKYDPLLIRLNLMEILPFKCTPAMFILCCLFSMFLVDLFVYVCLFISFSTLYGE